MKPFAFLLASALFLLTACDNFNKPLVPFIAENLATVVGQGCNTSGSICKNSCVNHSGEWAILPGEETKFTIPLFNYYGHNLDLEIVGDGNEYIVGDTAISDDNRYFTFSVKPSASGDLIDLTLNIKTLNEDGTLRREMSPYKLPPMRARYINNDINSFSLTTFDGAMPTVLPASIAPFNTNIKAYDVFVYIDTDNIMINAEADDKARIFIDGYDINNYKAVDHNIPMPTNTANIKIEAVADCGRRNAYTLNVRKGNMLDASNFSVSNDTGKIYNANPQSVTVSYTNGATAANAGNNITVVYKGTDTSGASYDSDTAPTNAGTYGIYVKTNGGSEYPPITEPLYLSSFSIARADPVFDTVPTVTSRTYNPSTTLNSVPFSGGRVNGVDGEQLEGNFAWTSTGIVPTVPVSGSTGYPAVFKPSDTTNYNDLPLPENVKFTVNRATPTIARPGDPTYRYTNYVDIGSLNNPNSEQTIQYGYSTSNNSSTVSNWSTNRGFGNLSIGTTYYFFARVNQSDNYNAAVSSNSRAIHIRNIDFAINYSLAATYGSADVLAGDADVDSGNHNTYWDLKIDPDLSGNTLYLNITYIVEEGVSNWTKLQLSYNSSSSILDLGSGAYIVNINRNVDAKGSFYGRTHDYRIISGPGFPLTSLSVCVDGPDNNDLFVIGAQGTINLMFTW